MMLLFIAVLMPTTMSSVVKLSAPLLFEEELDDAFVLTPSAEAARAASRAWVSASARR